MVKKVILSNICVCFDFFSCDSNFIVSGIFISLIEHFQFIIITSFNIKNGQIIILNQWVACFNYSFLLN